MPTAASAVSGIAVAYVALVLSLSAVPAAGQAPQTAPPIWDQTRPILPPAAVWAVDSVCLLQAVDYGESETENDPFVNGTEVRGYAGTNGFFKGRLASVEIQNVPGQYLIDDDRSQLTSDLRAYVSMNSASFGIDGTLFVVDQHTVDSPFPGEDPESIATLTRVDLSGGTPVVLAQVDLCAGEPTDCTTASGGGSYFFSIKAESDKVALRKVVPEHRVDNVDYIDVERFWRFDYNLNPIGDPLGSADGCLGDYDPYTGLYWSHTSNVGISVCLPDSGETFLVMSGVDGTSDPDIEAVTGYFRGIAVDGPRDELVVVATQDTSAGEREDFLYRFELDSLFLGYELATFSASNAEELYRIVYENDLADRLWLSDLKVAGGVYWASSEINTSGRGARFVVGRLDIAQASPGADGIDEVVMEVVADTTASNYPALGTIVRDFVAHESAGGCDSFSTGWKRGSVTPLVIGLIVAGSVLFCCCCCFAILLVSLDDGVEGFRQCLCGTNADEDGSDEDNDVPMSSVRTSNLGRPRTVTSPGGSSVATGSPHSTAGTRLDDQGREILRLRAENKELRRRLAEYEDVDGGGGGGKGLMKGGVGGGGGDDLPAYEDAIV